MTVYPNDVHARLHEINQRIRFLLDHAPSSVKNANAAIRRQDGFGERGESAGRSSVIGSSVESAITEQTRIESELEEMLRVLDVIRDYGHLGQVERVVKRWAPAIESATSHTPCDGGPSHVEWSKAECGEWVDYDILESGAVSERGDGLCVACRKRKQRWLKANAVEFTVS